MKSKVPPGRTGFKFPNHQSQRHSIRWMHDQVHVFGHDYIGQKLETMFVSNSIEFFEEDAFR